MRQEPDEFYLNLVGAAPGQTLLTQVMRELFTTIRRPHISRAKQEKLPGLYENP